MTGAAHRAVSRRALLSLGAVTVAGAALGLARHDGVSHPSELLAVQRRLNALGYWCGRANGVPGELTTCAVLAFQKQNGLYADGELDRRTRDLLPRAERPRPRPGTAGTLIEVDLERQVLRAVYDGEVAVVLHASTGSGTPARFGARVVLTQTPLGRFRIHHSHAGTRSTPLGVEYRPHLFLGPYSLYGRPDLAELRAPATAGGVAVHPRAMDLLVGLGHLRRDRVVHVA